MEGESMLKILILGSTGMVGHMLTVYLEETHKYQVVDCARRPFREKTKILDLNDFSLLKTFLLTEKFDIIVNGIGILNENAEKDKEGAIRLNSYLPHYLRHYCSKLIHISTDCVFSGKRGHYSERDKPDGDTFYAKTKALGEIVDDPHVTLRTSIIGPDLEKSGIGLLNWFLLQKGVVKGYTQAIWTGITTLELAKVVEEAIDNDLEGLYHLAPKEAISKYHLLLNIKEVFQLDGIQIIPFKNDFVDKSLISTRDDFNINFPSYESMLKELRTWMINHLTLYPHYHLSGA